MTRMDPTVRRILVVNGKGGCGKTTIATNLATAYAHLGHTVVLIDHDAQASSTHWLQNRAAALPPIHLLEAHRRTAMYTTRAFQQRLPAGVTRIVIDTPSAVGEAELDNLLRNVDAIVVPLLPSSIDMRAGTRFLAQLLHHRMYRARPVPVGVIANRVRHSTLTHSKLLHFLNGIDVPTIATFAESGVYTQLAEDGAGIFDLRVEADIEDELAEWQKLLRWLDGLRVGLGTDPDTTIRRGPCAATVHPRLARSALLQ